MDYTNFINVYYGVYLLLVVFYIFTRYYKLQNKKLWIIFNCLSLSILVLSIIEMLELKYVSLNYSSFIRLILVILNYSFRPAVAYFAFLLMYRSKPLKNKIYYAIPLFINFILNLTILFSDIVLSISENNIVIKGPLFSFSTIVTFVYLIVILILSVIKFNDRDKKESIIGIFIFSVSFLSIFIESIFNFKGVFLLSSTISMIFYFMNFLANAYSRDSLTDAYLRSKLYENLKYIHGKTYIIILDINGLKLINDNYGHDAGDKAITLLSSIIFKNIRNNASFYRMGGDEFSILVKAKSVKEINLIIKNIKSEYNQTNYGVAAGYATFTSFEDFEPAYILADEMLYKDKEEYWNKRRNIK